MNKIFKVIYSKIKHCYVVVSELAKSHCKTAGSHTARSKTALTAAVLLALGTFSFFTMPNAEAESSLSSNDFFGANYQYTDENGDTKEYTPIEKAKMKNHNGGGATAQGAITAGLNAQAGKDNYHYW